MTHRTEGKQKKNGREQLLQKTRLIAVGKLPNGNPHAVMRWCSYIQRMRDLQIERPPSGVFLGICMSCRSKGSIERSWAMWRHWNDIRGNGGSWSSVVKYSCGAGWKRPNGDNCCEKWWKPFNQMKNIQWSAFNGYNFIWFQHHWLNILHTAHIIVSL